MNDLILHINSMPNWQIILLVAIIQSLIAYFWSLFVPFLLVKKYVDSTCSYNINSGKNYNPLSSDQISQHCYVRYYRVMVIYDSCDVITKEIFYSKEGEWLACEYQDNTWQVKESFVATGLISSAVYLLAFSIGVLSILIISVEYFTDLFLNIFFHIHFPVHGEWENIPKKFFLLAFAGEFITMFIGQPLVTKLIPD